MRKVILTTGAPIETLTARQRDVLAMIGQGLTNKRIARVYEISPETVKSHVKRIFLKLAVGTRAQAVSRAGSLAATVTVSRPDFSRVAAILLSAVVAVASPERILLAQTSGDTMARCQELFALYDRYNSDTLTRPMDVRMGLEDCRKGNVASGVATLKRSLERAHIPIPPESGVAQTPAPLR